MTVQMYVSQHAQRKHLSNLTYKVLIVENVKNENENGTAHGHEHETQMLLLSPIIGQDE